MPMTTIKANAAQAPRGNRLILAKAVKIFGASDFCVGWVLKRAKYEILAECKTKSFMRSY